METWRHGALKRWSRAGSVQMQRHGCLEIWRRADFGMELWSSRGVLQMLSIEVWSSGVLFACCKSADMEEWSRECWWRAAGVQGWKHGYRALEVVCRRADIEGWSPVCCRLYRVGSVRWRWWWRRWCALCCSVYCRRVDSLWMLCAVCYSI